MKETRNYEVWSRERSIMPGIRELIDFFEKRDRIFRIDIGAGKILFALQEGRSLSTESLSEAATFLENVRAPIRWELVGVAPKSDERVSATSPSLYIDLNYTGALITVNSSDLDLLEATFRQIERSFGFQQLPPGIGRIRHAPHATAMIGCHFDEVGRGAGQRLQKFLSLVGFACVDIADDVRALPIQDKVSELLDKNTFYIGIVTGQREHAWITAESSYALAKHKEVILILQQGVKFDPTFFGHDREHLTFDKIIDESFIGLLQDFRSRGVLGL